MPAAVKQGIFMCVTTLRESVAKEERLDVKICGHLLQKTTLTSKTRTALSSLTLPLTERVRRCIANAIARKIKAGRYGNMRLSSLKRW